jgi:hypothetical protein
MSMKTAIDFYELFAKYPAEFAASATYPEFCRSIGKQHLEAYVWAPPVFATAKAGKQTFHPLRLPTVERFADLFIDAKLLPTHPRAAIPQGYRYLSTLQADTNIPFHIGGTRGWSKTQADVRSHYGATYHGVYVRSQPAADTDLGAYEAIRREDGILVLAQSSHLIFSEWLALLPLSESIETLFDEPTRQLIAREREAELAAWGSKA